MGSALPAGPYTFRPIGLYDSLEGESAPNGSCFSLQNLVKDITTPFVWLGRPAAFARTSFSGFTNPGAISVMLTVGTRIYGLLATSRNAGYDEPFVFDTASNTFIAVSNVLATNVPATQASSGPWTPPTMDIVGSKVFVTHPGFSGSGANFFGYFDISTLATPTWNAANTATNGLPSVPTAVKQFKNRSYFACGNLAYYTDSLSITMTAGTQFLTIGGNSDAITGFGGIPVTQTQGGILMSLIAFKAAEYWVITGDAATSNLLLNGPVAVGTSAPRTITQTPLGVAFLASDGIRTVDLSGNVSAAPLPGVQAPFQQAYTPSRACAAYNNSVLRVALQTTTNPITQANAFVEYWYDFKIQQWNGPHTFSSSVMAPVGTTFYCASDRAQGKLFQSNIYPSSTDTFTELGATLQYNIQSTMLAHDIDMAMKNIIESQWNIDFGAAATTATVQMLSAASGAVGNATITSVVGTYWGQFIWGQANWTGSIYGLRTYNIDWDAPVVYKNAAIAMFGNLTTGLRIGSARIRVEELEYMNEQNPA
jgi:hypothetical protein